MGLTAKWHGLEGKPATRSYHLYCLTEWGRVGYAEHFDALDDRGALRHVRELRPNARICEIWEDHRLVACIKSKDLVVESA